MVAGFANTMLHSNGHSDKYLLLVLVQTDYVRILVCAILFEKYPFTPIPCVCVCVCVCVSIQEWIVDF